MNRPIDPPLTEPVVDVLHRMQLIIGELDTTQLTQADCRALAEFFQGHASIFSRKAFSKLAGHIADQLSLERTNR